MQGRYDGSQTVIVVSHAQVGTAARGPDEADLGGMFRRLNERVSTPSRGVGSVEHRECSMYRSHQLAIGQKRLSFATTARAVHYLN